MKSRFGAQPPPDAQTPPRETPPGNRLARGGSVEGKPVSGANGNKPTSHQPPKPRAKAILALGEILIERKLVTPDQFKQAMDRQKRTRRRLGRVLVEMGFVTPEAVLEALSPQLGAPSTRVNSYTVNAEALQCLSEKVARKHMAFPLLKVGTTLMVAIASPKNLHALNDLRFASGCEVQLLVAMETEIQSALDKYYGNRFGSANDQEKTGTVVIDVPGPQLDLHDEQAERSATSLVDRIIARAATDRASDIHLEPMKSSLRVRFRIDGTFHDVAHLLLALAPAVIARIKVLSGMDISEHRNPQDGRFSATVGGHGLGMRTSTYPTIWGEKAVLRLLDRATLQLTLDGVMRGPALDGMRDLISRPEGIILVTGPTGSGKTSTLYASLAELAEMSKNIITIEDPVEYWLPGVNQGQTNHKAGFDFARGLRAMLRQDPDVIMVGEIRDTETMETAGEAALTGHLVLHAAHEQCRVDGHATRRDGGRAVSACLRPRRRAGTTARAKDLRDLPRRGPGARYDWPAIRRQPARENLEGDRLRGMSRDRLPRPLRRLRAVDPG